MRHNDPETNPLLSDSHGSNAFTLERYKYILKEVHFLNENVHKYLTLFQTLATAVVGAGAAVFMSWRSLSIDAGMARMTIQALLGLFLILAAFVILSVLAGVFSWLDYRREEVALLDELVRPGFRSLPRARNFVRWYETYVLLFMLVIAVVSWWFVEHAVIPQIK
jgi:hypothetical protein